MTDPVPSSFDAEPRRQPRSCGELFRVFTLLALQGFGGVLAVAQRELVERQRWLSRAEFVEMMSISQVLPGPNIINLSLMFGDRHFGLRGAFAATGGMLFAPLVLVLVLAALYTEFARLPVVSGALRGMGAVAAGLVIATALKLFVTLKANPMGIKACTVIAVLTFGMIALARWPLAGVLLGLGSLAIALAWHRLR